MNSLHNSKQIYKIPELRLPFWTFYVIKGVLFIDGRIRRKAERNNGILTLDILQAIEDAEGGGKYGDAALKWFYVLTEYVEGHSPSYHLLENLDVEGVPNGPVGCLS